MTNTQTQEKHHDEDIDYNIDEIPLPDSHEYPTPSELGENSDGYLTLRSYDNEAIKLIAGATRLVHAILKKHDRPISDVNGRIAKNERLSPRKARDLAYYLGQIEKHDVRSLVLGRRVNPYFDLLLDAGDLLLPEAAALTSSGTYAVLPRVAKQLENVAAQMRARASNPEWQTRVESILRRCRDNHASLREYVHAIYTHRASRNLVIRLDLGYITDHAGLMSRPMSISQEQAKDDFDRFIRHVRENYPLTGFARRLEYGIHSGLHFHVLIFLNGHDRWGEMTVSQMLGEYWRDNVTLGQGRFYNCNRGDYRWRGIGLIDRRDRIKLQNLIEHAGRYLTKSDFWVEGDSTGKGFVRGQMPTNPITTGRPRAEIECDAA